MNLGHGKAFHLHVHDFISLIVKRYDHVSMFQFVTKLGLSNTHSDVPLVNPSILISVNSNGLDRGRGQNILTLVIDGFESRKFIRVVSYCILVRVVHEEHFRVKLVVEAHLGVFLSYRGFRPKV